MTRRPSSPSVVGWARTVTTLALVFSLHGVVAEEWDQFSQSKAIDGWSSFATSIDAARIVHSGEGGGGSRRILAETCADTATNCITGPKSPLNCGPLVNASCLANLCATKPAWAAGCIRTCSRCPPGSCTDTAANCELFPKNTLNCGPIVTATCLANLCVTKLAWAAGCSETCRKCPGTCGDTASNCVTYPKDPLNCGPLVNATCLTKLCASKRTWAAGCQKTCKKCSGPAPTPRPAPKFAPKPAPKRKPMPKAAAPKPASKPAPKPKGVSPKPKPASKPAPKPAPKPKATSPKPKPAPRPRAVSPRSTPALKPSPAPPSPGPSAPAFSSGIYLIVGTKFMLRCTQASSVFTCMLNGTFSGTISPAGVLTMRNFTATWASSTSSIKWSFGASWAYLGARLAPPPGRGGGVQGGGDLGFGLNYACQLNYDVCKNRLLCGGDVATGTCPNSCPVPESCTAGNNAFIINQFLDRVSSFEATFNLNKGVSYFLNLTGLGINQFQANQYDTAFEAYIGASCGASGASNGDISLYSGAAIKSAGGACAQLAIDDSRIYFGFKAVLLRRNFGCVALDSCSGNLYVSFPNLRVNLLPWFAPDASVLVDINNVLVVMASTSVTPDEPLWTLGRGYSDFNGSFDSDALLGQLNIVSTSASVKVGYSGVNEVSVTGNAGIFVAYPNPQSSATTDMHAEDQDLLFNIPVGPVLAFGHGQSIDLSWASLRTIIKWHYSAVPWVSSVQVRSVVTGDTRQFISTDTRFLSKLQVQLRGGVPVRDLVANVPKARRGLEILLADMLVNMIPSIYADDADWGIHLRLTSGINLRNFQQDVLDFIGYDIPQSLPASARLVVSGSQQTSGDAVILGVAADGSKLFSVNFCSTSFDCLDENKPACIIIGSIGSNMGVCGQQTSCKKNTYQRAAGKPRTVCPVGELGTTEDPYDPAASLCFPACSDGYAPDGFMCREVCPPDFFQSSNATHCLDNVDVYSKDCCCDAWFCCGTCQAEYEDTGCDCVRDRTRARASYVNGQGVAPICSDGLLGDAVDGKCYVKCDTNYVGRQTVCQQVCPTNLAGRPSYDFGGDFCTTHPDGSNTISAASLCPIA